MEYTEILTAIDDKNNIVLLDGTISQNGIANIKYVLMNKKLGSVLSVWGANVEGKIPDWVMRSVVVNGQVVDLDEKQQLTVFKKMSYKYWLSERAFQNDTQRQKTR